MKKTIWLLAFMRQLLEKKKGILPSGIINPKPRTTDITIMNILGSAPKIIGRMNPRNMPARKKTMNIAIGKLAAPVGVILRWHISIAS